MIDKTQDYIVAQAIRRSPYTMGHSVCVSWWKSGKVSETHYYHRQDGMTTMGFPVNLPSTTQWAEQNFFKLLKNE